MEIFPEGVAQFRQWFVDATASNTVLELYVAVDQGATNARVAIGTPTGEFAQLVKFQAASTAQLVSRLGEVAAWVAAEEPAFRPESVKGACMAAAGRVLEGGARVEITNYAGGAAEQMLSIEELPHALFPPHNTRFLNDLESACYGIAALGNSGKLAEYFETLLPFSGPVTPVVLRPTQHLVLAVGTGLGVGLLTHPYSGSDFQVLPLEGGHVLLNTVGVDHEFHAEEQDLLQFAGRELYGGKFSIEYEDLVSGRGVLLLYNWIAKRHPEAPALTETGQVAKNACSDPPCPYAAKALLLHYEYLMRCAQNLSIGLNSKGIFLAGDNQVANRNFVFNNKNTLRQVFLDHPKSAWIDSIPVYAQFKTYPVNLAGALHIAQRCARI